MAMTRFERNVAKVDRDEAELRRGNRRADFMEREQALRDREGDVYAAARQRRLAANRAIAESDPGRFSAFERRALLGLQHTKAQGDIPLVDRQERQGLQDFELAKLKQQGANELAVAEQKRFGMREQGSAAAEWGFKGEQEKAKSELEKAEKEWAAREKIAGLDAEAKKYGFDKDAEARKYGADATVDAETERQKGALAVAKQQGATATTVAGIQQQGAVGVAAQQARVAAAQQARKDSQNTEMLLQRERASLRKAHPTWTDEQIDAAARKNIGGEGELDRFRK